MIRLVDHIASQDLALAEKVEENKRLVEELQQVQSQLTSQAEVWETDKVWLSRLLIPKIIIFSL